MAYPTLLGPTEIPGVGTGVAYASGDAFGTVMAFTMSSKAAILHGALLLDLDNEKIQKDIFVFDTLPTDTSADNAAFTPPDADLLTCIAAFSIGAGDYIAAAANAVGCVRGINIPIVAPSGTLWVRVVTRGADNIAASNIPLLGLYVI